MWLQYRNLNGVNGTIGSTPIKKININGVHWGATEIINGINGDTSIFFGMITNPDIKEILLISDNTSLNLNLVGTEEKKFFKRLCI